LAAQQRNWKHAAEGARHHQERRPDHHRPQRADGWADLNEYARFNREFLEHVRTQRAAGKSVEEFAAAWKIPSAYAGYEPPAADRLKGNIQVIFDELK
jgi:hypothetical protein